MANTSKRKTAMRKKSQQMSGSVGSVSSRSKLSASRTPMVENDSPLYEPDFVSHPGDTIVDYLETNGWSQSDLARRTGLAPKTISEICNSKASISAPTSLALEKVLQRPAHFWLNLQRRYDEAKERKRALAQLPEWDHWASRFPIAEMQKFLWLPKTKSKSD